MFECIKNDTIRESYVWKYELLCFSQGPQGESGPPGQQGLPGPHVSFSLVLFFWLFVILTLFPLTFSFIYLICPHTSRSLAFIVTLCMLRRSTNLFSQPGIRQENISFALL